MDTPADAVGEAKARLKAQLRTLEEELNRLLARTYGVKVEREADYRRWLASHKPFHWFVEFYGVLQRGAGESQAVSLVCGVLRRAAKGRV